MELKELMKVCFDSSELYSDFETAYARMLQEMENSYRVKQIKHMRGEIDKYIKSIDQVIRSFSNPDNTPYRDEMHP